MVNTLEMLCEIDDFCTLELVDSFFFKQNTFKYKSTAFHCHKREILEIIRRMNAEHSEEILEHSIRDIERLSQREDPNLPQIVSLYLKPHLRSCLFSFCSTMQYSERPEATLVARTAIPPNMIIPFCEGRLFDIEDEFLGSLEEKENDFSIAWSLSKGKMQILLGPIRYVNHRCKPNCRFHHTKKNHVGLISIKEIDVGDELTVFYGKDYFSDGNTECKCIDCKTPVENKSLRSRKEKKESNQFLLLDVMKANSQELYGVEWPLR